MSSSRLPGKVLNPLAGKPVIWHVYNRAKRCRLVDRVIVATSTDKSDDPLVAFCRSNELEFHRGSLDNVLSRYTDILKRFDYPYFVRITGDCPLIHPDFIDNQIMALYKFDGDLIWIKESSTVLEGQGVFSSRSMSYIHDRTDNPDDLEHVGSIYISEHPEEFRIVQLSLPEDLVTSQIRITLDEQKDYEFLQKIFSNEWSSSSPDLIEVLAWLKMNPRLVAINQSVRHKELNQEITKRREKWANLEKAGHFRYKGISASGEAD